MFLRSALLPKDVNNDQDLPLISIEVNEDHAYHNPGLGTRGDMVNGNPSVPKKAS